MGSSKIVFVGAVAVIIGLFGYGIKSAEKKSADIAIAHAYRLQAKSLAEQGLQVAARQLPRKVRDLRNKKAPEKDSKAGKYSWEVTKDGMPREQLKITSYGKMNGQMVSLVSTLEELPRSKKRPENKKTWNGWELVSSVRTFTTYTPTDL